jgi:type 1 glutamine amidotransferase
MGVGAKRCELGLMRSLLALAATCLIAWGAVSGPAAAAPADCPAAWTPYSSRSLLVDLLLDPRTRAVLEQQGLLKGMPPFLLNPTPPTFAAIVTPAWMLSQRPGPPGAAAGAAPDALQSLDRALSAIPVTREAATRRCARYDHQPPTLPTPERRPAILVFEKITGFRDVPSVTAAHKAFADMAARRGWSVAFTENGAVFNPAQLAAYDAVVWNNVSGDALTVPQEKAFQAYLAHGGGFAGVHGAGGDPVYIWDWYRDVLLGARFIGHPMNPQFQAAKVVVEDRNSGVTAHLPDSWTMTEEWYSFAASPRTKGVHVLARLDESTYNPGPKLAMGDHPIAWSHCVGNGRAFYTAIGHRPESYTEPHALELLEQGVAWAAGAGDTSCKAGREVAKRP